MTTHARFQKSESENVSDSEYINGLKSGDEVITHKFFYELCHYALDDIRVSLMHGKVDYDDLVNELYLYLYPDHWHKVDTFSGLNGCHLKSWMTRTMWRFFLQKRRYLLGFETDDNKDITTMGDDKEDDFNIEITMDVEQTLKSMSNKTYLKVLKMLLIEGYTPEEVAVQLNTTVSNVYNIKHRAIVQFVQIYGRR